MQQFTTVLIYVAILGGLWFVMIRPQQKKEKETQKMRKDVVDGDDIVTIGGIYGKVISQKEDVLTIEVGADKVKLKIARWSIAKIEREK